MTVKDKQTQAFQDRCRALRPIIGQQADQFDGLPRNLGKVERLALHRFLPGIEAGEFEQRFRKPPHLLGGAQATLSRRGSMTSSTIAS